MSWLYNKKVFTDKMIPKNAHGFLYMISLTVDGKKMFYVGKKNFYSVRNVKLGKRALAARKDKRGSKKKRVEKLSYQNYYSSNDVIKKAVKGGIKVKREILKICYSKIELTYEETKELFVLDVLNKNNYLNNNILGRFYRNNIK